MAIEVHPITDRVQWLELRKPYITASVVGGCPAFNCHPYVTPLRIYAEKRGVEFPFDDDNKVLRRGRWLEGAFPKIMGELRPEWSVTAPDVFLCDPDIGIGATPDFYRTGDPRGRGILQCKTTAYSVWKRDWDEGKEPPFWVVLQALTEAMLAQAAFAAVAVMLVDAHNLDVAVLDIPRHAAAEAKIINEVRRFRDDIRNGIEPPVDFERDGAVLKLLLPRETPGAVIDLAGNNEIPDILATRAVLMAEMKRMKNQCERIENRLRAIMQDAATATGLDDWSISFKVQKRKGYVVKPSEPRVLLIKDKRPADQRPQADEDDDEE